MAKGPKPKTRRKIGDPRATKATLKGLRENLRLINDCNRSIKEFGITYMTNNNILRTHPLLDTRTKAWSLVLRACSLLGIEPPKSHLDAVDPYEEFLRRKKK